jgi:multidrug efflux pump subunit AcrB
MKSLLQTLLQRPIAVTMVLIVLVAVGILSFTYIPVSFMPEIDIPRITVQMSEPGASVSEVEQQMITPMRYELSQVAGLKEIETQSRMDGGSISLSFEPGSNMSLLFIDVNEKIDRAMSAGMPKNMERPKVIKASAMDIPAFYVDVTLKEKGGEESMAQLSRLVRNVIAKRIEQLPQTAMVDFSGTVGSEIDVVPDMEKLQSMGLTTDDIERAISENNIVLQALSISSGIYRYNIHFDAEILNKEDVENIYIRHEGRMLQLKDVCEVREVTAVRNGIVRSNGKDAVTLAVIKQNDAQMADLQKSMAELLDNLRADYPDLEFTVTRDQTELLTYSMNNLEWNLVVGALLACIILFVFNGGWRIPLLVVISIPLSLILTLLSFYVLGISLNIVSLSGLILGVGMIVDNSIIVIDNIIQRNDPVAGTREVFMPMLSSVLTTCSVFLPLIFLSGTAGALFYDQAMGVTIALFASLLVAALVVPVYYHVLHKRHKTLVTEPNRLECILQRYYERGMKGTLRHAKGWVWGAVGCLVLILVLFPLVRKERMPYMEHSDALLTIDWNAGITTAENDWRVQQLLEHVAPQPEATTSMAGVQEFVLSHTKELTGSEAVVYLKASSNEVLDSIQESAQRYVAVHYPKAKIDFGISGNVYDVIFQTDKPDLEIRLQRKEGGRPSVAEARSYVRRLQERFPEVVVKPVVTEENLCYSVNPEQLAYYHVTYEQLYNRFKELTGSNQVHEIANGAQSVPVIIGQDSRDADLLLANTIANSDGVEVPLSYLVGSFKSESFKRLSAGSEGEYYSIVIEQATDAQIKAIMEDCKAEDAREDAQLKSAFHGNYFDSRAMIRELAMVLLVAVLLLYFILAAQFESLLQPAIILTEIVIDVSIVLLVLLLMGESLNIMSMIGLVVMSGIIINDSILKVDTTNQLYRSGMPLLRAVLFAGQRRLKPIVMTSLTTILALLPFLNKGNMGAAMQYPLSLTLIVGMVVGTLVSLYFVPLVYYLVYKKLGKIA